MTKTVKVLLCVVLALVLLIGGMMIYLSISRNQTPDWEDQYAIGMEHLDAGSYHEAIAAFDSAIEIDPARYEAYVAQGDAYMGLERFDDAVSAYQMAHELSPEAQAAVSARLESAQRAISAQTEPVEEKEETVPETTVAETEPVAVAVPGEKQISRILTLYNGEVSTEDIFHYDHNGNMLRRITSGYNNGEKTYSVVTEFFYDAAGMLMSSKEANSPFTEKEYHYDLGVLTGYTYNEVMGDMIANSVTYHYERDENGNVVKITTTSSDSDLWTNGEYTYDDQGRCISAYEHERYGDHEFKRSMTYDHSSKGAVITTKEETMFEFTNTTRMVQFGDMEYGYIYGPELYDGYTVVTDPEGYITGIQDDNGQLIAAFEYIAAAEQDSVEPLESVSQNISFSDIPAEYLFSSGAGGWGTYLTVSADGSFKGQFHDSNMGETGDGYPKGTVYYCNFHGKFSNPVQVNEYTYQVSLESFFVNDQEGFSYIENEIKYIANGPYGFDGPDAYYIYLPGIPSSMMPQGAFDWVNSLYGSNYGAYEVYVICSANGELPFVGEF